MANYQNDKIKAPNVADRYRGWLTDAIKADHKDKSFPYAVLMENLLGDFNLATVFRNANVFGAREIFYLGKKKYDPRGGVGAQFYSDIKFLPNYSELEVLKLKYKLIAVELTPDAIEIGSFEWPNEPFMLCFGEEGRGISPELLKMCESVVKIEQFGVIRSLNVGTASGIAMFACTQKMVKR